VLVEEPKGLLIAWRYPSNRFSDKDLRHVSASHAEFSQLNFEKYPFILGKEKKQKLIDLYN